MCDAAVCTLLSYLSFLLHFLKKIIFLLVLVNSVMNVITTTGLGHCFRSFGGSNVLQASLSSLFFVCVFFFFVLLLFAVRPFPVTSRYRETFGLPLCYFTLTRYPVSASSTRLMSMIGFSTNSFHNRGRYGAHVPNMRFLLFSE